MSTCPRSFPLFFHQHLRDSLQSCGFPRCGGKPGSACLPSGRCSACRRGTCENSLAPRARPQRPAWVPGCLGQGPRGWGGEQGLCSSPGSLQCCRWGYTSEGVLGDGQVEILGDKRENVSVHFLLVPNTTASSPKDESNLGRARLPTAAGR